MFQDDSLRLRSDPATTRFQWEALIQRGAKAGQNVESLLTWGALRGWTVAVPPVQLDRPSGPG